MKLLLFVLLAIALSATGYKTEDLNCIPGSIFKLDCNTCDCSWYGKIGYCTKMACQVNEGRIKYLSIPGFTRPEIKQVCKPGTLFKKYCNSCICTVGGTNSFCTAMACSKDVWNPDGTLKIPSKI